MLRINVHQIHGELVTSGAVSALKFNFQGGLVRTLSEKNRVIVFGASNDLGKNGYIHTKTNRGCTGIEAAGIGKNCEADQGDMGRVHGLELNPVFRTEPVDIVYEIFDSIEDTLEKNSVGKTGFEHGCDRVGVGRAQIYRRRLVAFRRPPLEGLFLEAEADFSFPFSFFFRAASIAAETAIVL